MSSFASVYFITLLFSIFFWYLNKIFKTPKRISPQTFHKKSTSRLGGAAIFLGLFIEVFALNDADIAYPNLSTFLMLLYYTHDNNDHPYYYIGKKSYIFYYNIWIHKECYILFVYRSTCDK